MTAKSKSTIKRVGRPKGKFDKAKQKAVLDALVRRRGNVSAACKDVQVSSKAFYVWKKRDPAFKRLLHKATKQLEHFLFEAACNFGLEGDATLLIFSLKALNRARFDDGFIKQKYAMDRGLPAEANAGTPMRAILISEPVPWEASPSPVKVDDDSSREH